MLPHTPTMSYRIIANSTVKNQNKNGTFDAKHCLMAINEAVFSELNASYMFYVWEWHNTDNQTIDKEIDEINISGLLANKLLAYVVKMERNFGLYRGDLQARNYLGNISLDFSHTQTPQYDTDKNVINDYIKTGTHVLVEGMK